MQSKFNQLTNTLTKVVIESSLEFNNLTFDYFVIAFYKVLSLKGIY